MQEACSLKAPNISQEGVGKAKVLRDMEIDSGRCRLIYRPARKVLFAGWPASLPSPRYWQIHLPRRTVVKVKVDQHYLSAAVYIIV